MAKYVAGIQYDGFGYSGWQIQNNADSVQQHVEETLSQIANESVTVFCSGRTDAGVHAREQVIHFESHAKRSDHAWRKGCNTKLPGDIRVMWCHEVEESFHARFSAIARQYRYVIYNAEVESALLKNRVNWVPYALNVDSMHTAGQALLGENDFTSFRASSCQANTAFRNIHKLSVTKDDDFIFIDITANAFLHHMVRNIVGSLIEVGREKQSTEWIKLLLLEKNRTKAGVTAKANGLYFIRAIYPLHYQLKQMKSTYKLLV